MRNIVLVDDDASVLQSLKLRLEKADFDVRTASNGREALQLIEKECPDILITDILMPEMEGIETILEVRRNHSGLKIIAMSGGGRAGKVDYLKVASDLGADARLTKPFTTQQLMEAIGIVRPGEQAVN